MTSKRDYLLCDPLAKQPLHHLGPEGQWLPYNGQKPLKAVVFIDSRYCGWQAINRKAPQSPRLRRSWCLHQLEEFALDPPDKLHWRFCTTSPTSLFWINHPLLEKALECLSQHQITPMLIVPDSVLLADDLKTVKLFIHQQQLICCHPQYRFKIAIEQAPSWLAQLQQQAPELHYQLLHPADQRPDLPIKADYHVFDQSQINPKAVLKQYQLLQGPYRWYRWQSAISRGFQISLLALLCSSGWVLAQSSWHHHLLKQQIHQKDKQWQQVITALDTHSPVKPSLLLKLLQQASAQLPASVTISSINYHDTQLSLSLNGASKQLMNKLNQQTAHIHYASNDASYRNL